MAERQCALPPVTQGDAVLRIIHPDCCDVPTWLVKVEIGDVADQHTFECKVCDATVRRTAVHERGMLNARHVEPALGL